MIIPLGMSGGSQVMLILKKEGDDDVMTTGPGAGRRQNTVCCIYVTLQCYLIVSLSSSVCVVTVSLNDPT